MRGIVDVGVLEHAPKSSDVPLCRREDPFWDPDVAEVFVVLDNRQARVVVTLRGKTWLVSRGRGDDDDVPKSRRRCATCEEAPRDEYVRAWNTSAS